MSNNIQAIRGMNDVLPEQLAGWRVCEQGLINLCESYGYQEIRFPIVESTQLFKRAVGEVTDIVEKEMYTFDDRNGDSLTLRPEGTAGCVRAMIQSGLVYAGVQRIWYLGPMFRHERPQQGRYRQFYQFGAEVFGLETPDIDAELIAMTAQCWRQLGFLDHVHLQINSLGSSAARQVYRNALVSYFEKHSAELDADSQRRLYINPLRILDSKNPHMAAIIAKAPTLHEFLDDESRIHFAELCNHLDALGIAYQVNQRLVRGLDYYNRTVFEWVTNSLGSQGTICAGGRYDGLVAQLGGKDTPAIGFALGLERLIALRETVLGVVTISGSDIYVIHQADEKDFTCLQTVMQLRQALPKLSIMYHCGGGSFKSQFKKADKSGAKIALVFGAEELAMQQVSIKFLRDEQPQRLIPLTELVPTIATLFTE